MLKTLKKPAEGWKIVRVVGGGKYVLRLQIPAGARVRVGTSDDEVGTKKCRADRVLVLDVWRIDEFTNRLVHEPDVYYLKHKDIFGPHQVYRTDKVTYPDSWTESNTQCSNGLHYFSTFNQLRAEYSGTLYKVRKPKP